jgi:hypothetical protein
LGLSKNEMRISVWAACLLIISPVRLYAQPADFAQTDFKKADSIAALFPRHSLKDLRSLTDKLTTPLSTEEEKFRAVYRWICNNIEYDYSLYLQNQQKKKKLRSAHELKAWNKKFSARVFKNLLDKQRSVCSGYSYLLKEMCVYAGLSCVIVDGYGRTAQANIRGSGIANHSWNAVQLNNKWYLCDATWSAGAYDTDMMRYVKKFDSSYFLPDPSLFVRNHYPLDPSWMLLYNKPTLKAFLNRPLVYSSAFRYKINQLLPETFDIPAARGDTVSFQFTKNSDHPIEKVELSIKGPKAIYSVYPRLYQSASGLYCIDHIFSAKGMHVVHVLVNSSYAFTYSVRVR